MQRLKFIFILFIIFNTSEFSFSQTKNDYIVTMIDDTSFVYYHRIKVRKVDDFNLHNSINILSEKLLKNELINNFKKKIQVGQVYTLELTPMYMIMDVYYGEDSMYLSPNLLGTVKINDEVIISSDYVKHPYATKNLKGLFYMK